MNPRERLARFVELAARDTSTDAASENEANNAGRLLARLIKKHPELLAPEKDEDDEDVEDDDADIDDMIGELAKTWLRGFAKKRKVPNVRVKVKDK